MSFRCFFPCFIVIFVRFKANPCDEVKCALVGSSLVLQAFGLCGGHGTQIHQLSFFFEPPNGPFYTKDTPF